MKMTWRRRATENELVDVDAFIRDGYLVIRDAFDADTAAACRAAIWNALARQGICDDDSATWPPLAELDGLGDGGLIRADSWVQASTVWHRPSQTLTVSEPRPWPHQDAGRGGVDDAG